LKGKPAYRIGDLYELVGSRATAYRVVNRLLELGFAERLNRGYFAIRSSVFQPFSIWPHMVQSLQSYRQARYFGRAYDDGDVSYAKRTLQGVLTLDYRAYELTGFQTPHTYYLYVDDVGRVAEELRKRDFSEGRAGRVAIMQKTGPFDNEIQRVYLDCLAVGGRSVLDAIAIELLYPESLTVRGKFGADLVAEVKEDLSVGPR
jgi:hypothetical protein